MLKGFLRICLLILVPQSGITQTPSQSAIVSSHPLATKAGFEILKQGGNAFDAAVCVAAVLSVVNKEIYGGGIWLLRDARQEQIQDHILDARLITNTSQNAPQENPLVGLAYLATHYGKLPLSKTLKPAMQLAKKELSINAKLSEVALSKPLQREYHDMMISTAPLPSIGGIGLIMALNILADFELNDLSDADIKHLIIESLRAMDCDEANYLSDIDSAKANFAKLISKDHALEWRKKIKMNQAMSGSVLDCKKAAKHESKVAHYAVLDQQGNSVSATLTSQDEQLTLHSPSLFEMPEGIGLISATDGTRSPGILLLSLLTAKDDYYPSTWMLTPRFYPSNSSTRVEFETGGFPASLQNALKLRGYQLKEVAPFGNVIGIFWDKKDNKVYAAADPRGKGLALVEKIN